MSLIQAIDISKEFSSHYVLKGVSCTVEHNSRIGLIGANGSGKSTLIKIILGPMEPSEGRVVRAKACRIAYLPQNLQLDQKQRMEDYIRASRPDFLELNAQITQLSEQLRQKPNPADEQRLSQLVERHQAIGALEFDNQLKFVLESLQFSPSTWHKLIGQFSGGEQTRICLAAMLLAPFDLLILDEPTNHLDIAMIRWLESYLQKLSQPYLIVSHDRTFLDNTINTIYSLDNGTLSITKGNYSSYKEAYEIARAARAKAAKNQEKWIAKTEDFIARNMGSQKTVQAKSRLKQLQKLERIEVPSGPQKIKLNMQAKSRSSNTLYRLENLSFGVGNLQLAREVNLHAQYKDRLAIIGPNGCGKTTLIKMLLDRHKASGGTLYRGSALDIAYYDQHQVSLDEGITVKDSIWKLAPLEPVGYVLGWLARFGFRGDDVDKQVSVLSGGERSRLYLAIIIHQKPNLLILDEPTNHLDIELTDSLLEALQDYPGSIIFVSHDRWFIRQLATRYWVFRKKLTSLGSPEIYSTVEEIDADLDEIIKISFSSPDLPKAKPEVRERKRKLNPYYLNQLQSQIEEMEMQIAQNSLALDEIHQKLSETNTYADPTYLSDLHARMRQLESQAISLQAELQELEHRYLELACEE